MKKNKNATSLLEKHLRLHFVVATAAFFIITVGFSLVMALSQLPENYNFSAYYFYALSTVVIPIIVLVLSYLLVPKYEARIDKMFWTILVAFIAMLLFATIQQVSYMLPFTTAYGTENDWMFAEAVRTGFGLLPIAVYFTYIYKISKK